ncbi:MULTISPECIES: hypothetical protein [Mycobacterium]|uniref:hypothetical protein n=1 Tax=Mycobacterium TaxID=1763 RepID=UPI001EF15ECD|nr:MULTISPECIES: hypothetical protein [Mycobacterium]BDB42956.1 hypothetical protein IWGMT90018_34020 [Mycobacterium kiyosense]BDE13818.1 hypothetical protein MKCMC460_26780 [Mycobacterium sp. 20KCMC460]GLB90816.1 hypothetical protein SRL2020130_36330 [Mycobacterium kiyosense]GLC00862.1 hypothetical protein SRL2020400_14530 [Mycobacterium kiyosense]GLC08058.1 hypothetical protein SRL2020411_27040 [Mycobacterium kiyosense]
MTAGGQTSDLKTVLAQHGRLDPRRAVDVVRAVAAAVDDAHARHGVHRNVSTATILLAGDGSVYLADAGGPTPSTDHTRALVVNTAATYRADIRALAAVLYECLTGHPPSPVPPGATVPRPSERCADLPAALDDVVARGLAADPAECFRSATELAAAAQRALLETPSGRSTIQVAAPSAPSEAATRTFQLPPRAEAAGPRAPGPPPAGVSAPGPYPPQPWTAPPARVRRRRRLAPVLAAVAIVVVVVAGAIAIPRLVGHSGSGPTATTTVPAPRRYTTNPVQLPFPPLQTTKGLAVDLAGNVYALAGPMPFADAGPFDSAPLKLYKLAPGATDATVLDIADMDLQMASDLTTDSSGALYYSSGAHVYLLEPGKSNPIRLPFRGFTLITAVTTDQATNTYAVGGLARKSSGSDYGVKKLPLGENGPTDLPFKNLYVPHGIGVDSAGSVYVSTTVKDAGRGYVLKLAPGATEAEPLKIPGLIDPNRIVRDSRGDVFIGDGFARGFFQLPAGGGAPVKVPLGANTDGLAVGAGDTLYVLTSALTDRSGRFVTPGRVLKFAPDG